MKAVVELILLTSITVANSISIQQLLTEEWNTFKVREQ